MLCIFHLFFLSLNLKKTPRLVPETFYWTTKLNMTFHQHEAEQLMTALSFFFFFGLTYPLSDSSPQAKQFKEGYFFNKKSDI